MSLKSRFEIREEVFDAVVRDLLGPAEGPDEEIAGTSIRDRYLVGQLAPSGGLIEPEQIDELTRAGSETLEEGQPETDTPQARSLMPSSIGMTFAVDGGTSSIEVTTAWGTYRKAKSETILTESGAGRTVWKRSERGGAKSLDLRDGAHQRLIPDDDLPRVVVEATTRRGQGDVWLVTLFLINGQANPDNNEEEAWLFQPRVEVAASDGSAVFVQRHGLDVLGETDPLDAEERALLSMQISGARRVRGRSWGRCPRDNRCRASRTSVIDYYECNALLRRSRDRGPQTAGARRIGTRHEDAWGSRLGLDRIQAQYPPRGI